ncbi:MAG TPA: phytanoyl-CoA dioxygenase family protein [Actinophytocola sp.]|uniref:phytanoyl-CoA dioxygenase family protein n=1 Tax=Actinophytocola sp. TaxID=1872138 RepID=UPI002DDD59A0|nr:phytanoyl-CoA dioxygenase family protein [Actinophytocola sp.]HEV2780512.1 phytanoyl-CoA dioxygenase family protein [Actinophytocola sp.]
MYPTFVFSQHVTPVEKDFYDTYGFLVYTGFADADEVRRIREDADRYQERIRAGEVPPEHVDTVAPVTLGPNGTPSYHHRLNYFTEYSPTAAALAADPRMDAIRTGLGGADHWLLDDTMNGSVWQLKSGERKSGYSRIRWHLDFPFGHPLSPAFTAGLYLDDSTRNNGCLAVIPQSHRFPVGPVPPEPLYVEVRAGDLVCHHERIYHGSEAMPRPTDRRATLYFYYCAGRHPGRGKQFADPERMGAVRSIFVGSDDAKEAQDAPR